ncbi:hypothetical protein ACSQ67_017687 [Phaseolus vulgaris]
MLQKRSLLAKKAKQHLEQFKRPLILSKLTMINGLRFIYKQAYT